MITIIYGRDSVCMGDDANNSLYTITMSDETLPGDFIRVLHRGGYGNDWPIPLSDGVNWTVKSNIGDIATIFGIHEKITYHMHSETTPLRTLSVTKVFCESKAAEKPKPAVETPMKERWGLPYIDQGCMAVVENKVEAIRDKALAILQKDFPELQFVVDPYILDDYYAGQMDKPGVIYPQFRLPGGKSEQDVVEDIVNHTRRYFVGKK